MGKLYFDGVHVHYILTLTYEVLCVFGVLPAMKNNLNNEELRRMIAKAGITQVQALERFNAGVTVRKLTLSAWKGYFCDPKSARYRHFSDALLAHARTVFGAES